MKRLEEHAIALLQRPTKMLNMLRKATKVVHLHDLDLNSGIVISYDCCRCNMLPLSSVMH